MNAGPHAAEVLAAARELLAYSADRDAELSARLAARREGYDEGARLAAEQWQAGYAAAVADAKAADRGLVGVLARLGDAEVRRWELRGEARTREKFALPHPSDYRGGPVAWAPGWAPGSGTAPLRGAA